MRARDVVGHKIVAIEQSTPIRTRRTGNTCAVHIFAIVLDNGTRIVFNVAETDTCAEYIVEATAYKPVSKGASQ